MSALDHEPVDDPVEQEVVIVVRDRQPGEVVPVLGRVLVQLDADGSHAGDDIENGLLGQPVLVVGRRNGIRLRGFGAGFGGGRLRRFGRQGIGRVPVGAMPSPAAAGGSQENDEDKRERAFHITSQSSFLPGIS